MSFTIPLEPGETILWQGRPAPRCYTFRNWRHSLVGLLLSLPSIFWLLLGRELVAAGHSVWLAWLPLAAVLLSAWLLAGHLFWARLQWEHIVYTLTDRRLLVQGGVFRPSLRSVPLEALSDLRVRFLGRELATLQLSAADGRSVRLCCLEHPAPLIERLQTGFSLSAGKSV